MAESNYCIALIFDENLIVPAAVLIQSISEHYFLNDDLDIVCCIPGNSDDIFSQVLDLIDVDSRISVSMVSINKTDHPFIESLSSIKTNHWGSRTELYKMFLGSFLPNKYARAIYLDTDMLVVKNIQPILDYPTINNIMAVVDVTGTEFKYRDLNSHGVYFNNGFLIVNLEWWRKSKIAEKFISYIEKNKSISLGSEEVMNACIKSDWHPLPFTFNFYGFKRDKNGISNFDESDILPVHYKNAIVMHFVGAGKPWNFEITNQEDKSLLGEKWRRSAAKLVNRTKSDS
jgi:lipopolysaccharide biosynthesis glycosyltransferase